jgi:formylmethanofuran dehydrogenase subunit B
MKFMLVTMMLANPMTYADKTTCLEAVDVLKSVDIEAVCIPAGVEQQSTTDRMIANMMKMIDRLEQRNKKDQGYVGGGTTKDALK